MSLGSKMKSRLFHSIQDKENYLKAMLFLATLRNMLMTSKITIKPKEMN